MDKKQEFLNCVADFMMNIGCSEKVAEWISFQFALESNFGMSRLATTRHNLCGMKIPMCRISTNIAISGTFSKYRTDYDCMLDYALWLAYCKFTSYDLTRLDLFQLKLKAKGYCPEDDYIERITNLLTNTKF